MSQSINQLVVVQYIQRNCLLGKINFKLTSNEPVRSNFAVSEDIALLPQRNLQDLSPCSLDSAVANVLVRKECALSLAIDSIFQQIRLMETQRNDVYFTFQIPLIHR